MTTLPLWCAPLLLVSCTGAIESPAGPNGSSNDDATGGSGSGNSSGDGRVGNQAGEPANLGTAVFAACDGKGEKPGPRLLRLLTRREYQNTVRDLLFADPPDVSSLPVEPRVRGFDNNSDAAAVTSRHIDSYLALAEQLVPAAIAAHKGQLLSCDPNAATCAATFVEEFGLRAFRRPLSAEEKDRYGALFADELTGGDFDEGMRLSMTSMLISSNFLYRSEVGNPRENGSFELTPYEVASALSYLYWGTMPDAALLAAAEADELRTAAQLERQAERMLDDPRAREQLGEFSLQWLRSDKIIGANKDAALFPTFTDGVREAMLEEQKRFFNQVVLEEKGSFQALFLADYVLTNGALAAFYGFSAPGQDFGTTTVPESSERGGLLGLGAVLAAHAHSNESSPIKRGLFVRDRLLCQDLPPPPPSLDTTPPGLDPSLTTRERFARHTSDSACSGCHQFIDGVGFGFEGFDGVGQERSVENGLPIDTEGSIRGLEGLDKKTTDTFRGPQELARLLAKSPSAQACLALSYYRFARGYEERVADACSLAALKKRFEARDLTVKDLLKALPQLSSFIIRSEG